MFVYVDDRDSARHFDQLVDRVSFEFMRRRGIQRALAFDRDFATEGFDVM